MLFIIPFKILYDHGSEGVLYFLRRQISLITIYLFSSFKKGLCELKILML